MRRKGLPAALLAAALALVAAVPAAAHHATATGPRAGGLELARTSVGPDVYTHGVDPMEPFAFESGPGAALLGLSDATPRRPVSCASDYFLRAIYAYPSDGLSDYTLQVPVIRATLERANYFLAEQSVLAGGPWLDLKFACDEAGRIAIDKVALSAKGDFGAIVSELRAMGYNKQNADYVVFYDALKPGGGCGQASIAIDQRPVIDNLNNRGNGHAVIWQPCWLGRTPLHEIAHTMGAVQPDSPNGTGRGGYHCNDGVDVMCYSDGGERNQTMRYPCQEIQMDCGRDDYFNPDPKPGSYLAKSWNLASPLNRFIDFFDRPPNPPRPLDPDPPKPPEQPPGQGGEGKPKRAKKERRRLYRDRWLITRSAPQGKASVYRLRLPRRAQKLRVILRGTSCRHCGPLLEMKLKRRGRKRCEQTSVGQRVVCRVRRPGKGPWRARVKTLSGEGMEFAIRATWRKPAKRGRGVRARR